MTGGVPLSEAASMQGSLWGARARDWADLQERRVAPAQQRVFDRLALAPGTELLDVACGAAGACVPAAAAGCRVHGVDVSEALLDIARERIPGGDFRVAELLNLPWEDGTFDAVTGFNAFQYAADPVAALREACRVLRVNGRLGVVVWGSSDQCEAVAHIRALRALMPPPPPGAPGPLAAEQRIAEMITEAGFTLDSNELVDCPWQYPDLATALRSLKSAGVVARIIDAVGEPAVDEALTTCLAGFQQPDGCYLFRNQFRALTAHARIKRQPNAV